MLQDQLTTLYYSYQSRPCAGQNPIAPDVDKLIYEILNLFGLPQNRGYENILIEFVKTEPLTGALIDATLIRLADEGAYFKTLFG